MTSSYQFSLVLVDTLKVWTRLRRINTSILVPASLAILETLADIRSYQVLDVVGGVR